MNEKFERKEKPQFLGPDVCGDEEVPSTAIAAWQKASVLCSMAKLPIPQQFGANLMRYEALAWIFLRSLKESDKAVARVGNSYR